MIIKLFIPLNKTKQVPQETTAYALGLLVTAWNNRKTTLKETFTILIIEWSKYHNLCVNGPTLNRTLK